MNNLEIIETDDGTKTYYSKKYDEKYHSQVGALKESLHKFVDPIKSELVEMNSISILDVGFGLGMNCYALLSTLHNEKKSITIFSLENDLELLNSLSDYYKESNYSFKEVFSKVIGELLDKVNLKQRFIKINYNFANLTVCHYFILGDARNFAKVLIDNKVDMKFDYCFMDPFSSKNNAELWTLDFFSQIGKYLSNSLMTYSAALPVLNALKQLNFNLYEVKPLGRKSPSILASKKSKNLQKLSNETMHYLNSRSALVYRDPEFNLTSDQIKSNQLMERESSNLKSLSQLRKGTHLTPK